MSMKNIQAMMKEKIAAVKRKMKKN